MAFKNTDDINLDIRDLGQKVYYNKKTSIDKLVETDSVNLDDYIDVSNFDDSIKIPIQNFKANTFIKMEAANRYRTDDNKLTSSDLDLFSSYKQTEDPPNYIKRMYFEEHPTIDNNINVNGIDSAQLLTKSNISEFEEYISHKKLNNALGILAYNWENEISLTKINSFKDLIRTTENDARATYKFKYNERISNEVDLSKFPNLVTSSSAVMYSVAGIVSVKSKLKEQKSGTIYLEARPNDAKEDDDWIVIDSAVFKFTNNSNSPGTYIVLTGYLQSNYTTRLRLNLMSQAYSMNLNDYRYDYALVNHYVNTFIGFINIPSKNTDTVPDPYLYFTNINYRPYLYGKSLTQISKPFNKSSSMKVSDLLTLFSISNHKLDISAIPKFSIKSEFKINGLRLTPTGKIYKKNDSIEVHPGMTLYPSYTSGIIQTTRGVGNQQYHYSFGSYAWGNGTDILNNISFSNISVLPNINWPLDTEIRGNISASIISAINNTPSSYITSSTTPGSYVQQLAGPITLGSRSVSSVATDSPRIKENLQTVTIDYSQLLSGKTIVGNVTCYITANTVKSGSGHGSESYGRIRYGWTSQNDLSTKNTQASSTIVDAALLSTKNYSRWITQGMCTGTSWNIPAAPLQTSFEQSPSYPRIYIQAAADPAEDDGSKQTIFTLNATVAIKYNYRVFIPGTTTSGTVPTTKTEISTITNVTMPVECKIVQNKKVYPNKILSYSFNGGTGIPSTFAVQDIHINDANFIQAGTNDTQLTVYPYPQDY